MDKTQTPYISVIMPVYNTGQFIAAALESVINQSLENIEIVLVNDGSTDNSGDIITLYKSRDSRIVVVDQDNSGLSVARNSGMKKATGEYIYFMDSDDLIEPSTLLSCYEFAVKEGLDVVCFDAKAFFNDDWASESSFIFDYSRKDLLPQGVYNGKDFLSLLVFGNGYKASVCLYIAKRELTQGLSLSFFKGIYHEDELFTPQLLLNAQKVGYLPSPFFKRRIRHGSIMQTAFSPKNLRSYMVVVDELCKSHLIHPDDRYITDKIVIDILNVVSYRTSSLIVKERVSLFKFLIKRRLFTRINIKNLLVLLFPVLIRIKKIFKK